MRMVFRQEEGSHPITRAATLRPESVCLKSSSFRRRAFSLAASSSVLSWLSNFMIRPW